MKRILITGASGLLGTDLIASQPDGLEICGNYNSPMAAPDGRAQWVQVDLTDDKAVRQSIEDFKPDCIIHAGSIGSVDFADKNRDLSHAINVGGTQSVVDAAKAVEAQVIFISSNAVFDGNNPPYSDDDPTSPANYYGELKAKGEEITLAAHSRNAVVRPILMYGWPNEGRRSNLVVFWLEKLAAGEQIKAVNDVWSKPLWVRDCSDVCWAVARDGHTGIFNICGSERVTLHDLAVGTARSFGHDPALVEAVPSSHFGDIANRPKDTSFTLERVRETLDIEPRGIMDGLAEMRRLAK